MTKRIITSIIMIYAAVGMASGQSYMGEFDGSLLPKVNKNAQTEFVVQEKVAYPQAWDNQAGLQVAFGSTDKLYFRKEAPEVDKNALSFSQSAWKGERVNMQVLVWSSDTLSQVRFETNELKNASGRTISPACIRMNMVRYVISNYPYGAKNVFCKESPYPNGFMMPDRFEPLERFDLPGKSAQPVWITLDIPQDAETGVYTGIITVKTTKETASLHLVINVQNPVLPKPSEWRHRLDLWQNPWVVAWYNHLKPWSEEHKTLLRQHLKLYADAGGSFITTYGVHSPWTGGSFRIEGGMIEWIKQKDDQWRFDYTIFDEYVQLCMACGINKAISIMSALPYGNSFRFLDENTGNYEYERWDPGTADYEKQWNIFLTDLKRHLKQKGWFDITYIEINESRMDETIAAVKVIKAHSPEWKITYAGLWHPEMDTLLDDYSCVSQAEPAMAHIKARAERGQTTTFYVCCGPAAPNNFLFSPPIEGRWISWYTAAYGYDGFLRWAYDAWTDDPARDARHTKWPAGDCFLIYPGGNSCIRFEKLREGIVEYEKIRILRENVAQSDNKKVKQLWQDFERQIAVFTTETDFDTDKITQDVYKGKALMDAISDLLITTPFAGYNSPTKAQQREPADLGFTAPRVFSSAPAASDVLTAERLAELRTSIRDHFFIPNPLPELSPRLHRSFSPAAGVRAEAITYATQHGMRVPAILYLPDPMPKNPDGTPQKIPAFVIISGHGGDKYRYHSYYPGIAFARGGAAVLTYDQPGEGERSRNRTSGTREHDYLRGSNAIAPDIAARRLFGLFLTDVQQAVSYLCTRPEIDHTRIVASGHSMGSFILSVAGAIETRIHAAILTGGGNIDGNGGYWEAIAKPMCQSLPYQSLRYLGDRPALLYAMQADRGPTLIWNGREDDICGLGNTQEPFFDDLHARVAALLPPDSPKKDNIFVYGFAPSPAGHRPYFITKQPVRWLHEQIGFPNWTASQIAAMPETVILNWASQTGYPIEGTDTVELHGGGTMAIDVGVPAITRDQLDVFTPAEWETVKDTYTFDAWLNKIGATTSYNPKSNTLDKPLVAKHYYSGFPDAHDTYNAISVASDGKVYYVLSSTRHDVGAQFYVYDPVTDQTKFIADLTEAVGEKEKKCIAQGKSHVEFHEHDGKLYFATHLGYYENIKGWEKLPVNAPDGYHLYPGGHFVSYDMKSGKMENLALAPHGEGIITMTMDKKRGHLYAITWPKGYLLDYNINTKQLKDLGLTNEQGEAGEPGKDYRVICRSIFVDPRYGNVYYSTPEGNIFFYHPDFDAPKKLDGVSLKMDYFGSYDYTKPGNMGYSWRKICWSENENVAYGTHGKSGYLFRFDPQIPKIEIVERITSEPSKKSGMYDQYTYGYLGFMLGKDQTIYFLTGGPAYKDGQRVKNTNKIDGGGVQGLENLHLVTFNIPENEYKDHGAIYFEDGSIPKSVNSIAMDQQGNIYTLARFKHEGKEIEDLVKIPLP